MPRKKKEIVAVAKSAESLEVKRDASTINISDTPEILSLFNNGGSAAGVPITRHTAYGIPGWIRGVDWIASQCARCRPHVYKNVAEGGKRKAEEHAAYFLLQKRWNPLQSAFDCLRQLVADSLWAGNGYAFIYRDERTGEPLELYVLDPQLTWPIVFRDAKSMRIANIKYQTSWAGAQHLVDAANIIHIRGTIGNFDNIVGMRLIDVVRDTLGLGLATQKYGCKYFANNAAVGLVVEVPSWIPQEKVDMFKELLHELHTGVNNSFKPLLLQNGTKLNRLSVSNDEAQWLASMDFNNIQIANCLGLSPRILGVKQSFSYNSLEQQRQADLDDCIDKHFIGLELELENKLMTEYQKDRDTHHILMDRDRLLSCDSERMTSKSLRDDYLNGLRTKNEVRHLMNLESVGLQGDVFLMPSNAVIEGEDTIPVDNDLLVAPEPLDNPPDTNATTIETVPPSMARSDERLAVLTEATLARLMNRLKKAVRSADDLNEHRVVFAESLAAFGPNGQACIDRLFAGLSDELRAILPEQSASVFERIDTNKLSKELTR